MVRLVPEEFWGLDDNPLSVGLIALPLDPLLAEPFQYRFWVLNYGMNIIHLVSHGEMNSLRICSIINPLHVCRSDENFDIVFVPDHGWNPYYSRLPMMSQFWSAYEAVK